MSEEFTSEQAQEPFEVDPQDLKRHVFEDDWYDAEVVGCRRQQARFGDGAEEVLWSFTVSAPGDPGDGQTVHEATSLSKGRGEQFYKFAVGLGLIPSGDAPARFDPREAVGTKCKIHIRKRSYKDRNTRETKFTNNVVQVAQA